MTSSHDGGFVLAYRRTLTHHAFKSHAEALAFTYLTMRAAWKQTKVRYKDRVITLERGQLAMSVRDLADNLERSRQWVERFLGRLQAETMIETSTKTGVTVITICNYDTYQCRAEGAGTGAGQDRDRTETQNKEEKAGKEGEEEKGLARGTRLTTDFVVPADWRVKAQNSSGLSSDRIRVEAEKFVDFWASKSGKDATKVDWEATWRNWIRNAVKYDKPKQKASSSVPGQSGPMGDKEYRDMVAEYAAENARLKQLGII